MKNSIRKWSALIPFVVGALLTRHIFVIKCFAKDVPAEEILINRATLIREHTYSRCDLFNLSKPSPDKNLTDCLNIIIRDVWSWDKSLIFIQEAFELSVPVINPFIVLGSRKHLNIKFTKLLRKYGLEYGLQERVLFKQKILKTNESFEKLYSFESEKYFESAGKNNVFHDKIELKIRNFGNYIIFTKTWKDMTEIILRYLKNGVWHPSLSHRGKFILVTGREDTPEDKNVIDKV